jgi:hypothetical protein
MIYLIVISGLVFTAGNVLWDKFGINEPKLFYVPLAVFLCALLYDQLNRLKEGYKRIFIQYLFILSLGNFLKQVFYTETIKQINDYVFGALVTVWLLYNLIKHSKWEMKK